MQVTSVSLNTSAQPIAVNLQPQLDDFPVFLILIFYTLNNCLQYRKIRQILSHAHVGKLHFSPLKDSL